MKNNKISERIVNVGLRISSALLVLIFAIFYSIDKQLITKLFSFAFITIGAEFVSLYYKNKQNIIKNLEKCNVDYYDMYVSYISMNIKLFCLCFSFSFSCASEVLVLAGLHKVSTFVISFMLALCVCVVACFRFNKTEFSVVFNAIFKIRKKDFVSDFTSEEKAIMNSLIEKNNKNQEVKVS